MGFMQRKRDFSLYLKTHQPNALDLSALNLMDEDIESILHLVNANPLIQTVNVSKNNFSADGLVTLLNKNTRNFKFEFSDDDQFSPSKTPFNLDAFLENPATFLLKASRLFENLFSFRLSSFTFYDFCQGMSECACGKANRFENKSRSEIEDGILKFINTNKADKSAELRLLSCGSGRFLQDFILFCRLIKSDYKNYSMSFVETAYEFEKDHIEIRDGKIDNKSNLVKRPPYLKHFIDLVSFLSCEYKLKIKINLYNNIQLVPKSNADVITAIDFDQGFIQIDELASVHSMLCKQNPSQLFLSTTLAYLIFDKEKCISKKYYPLYAGHESDRTTLKMIGNNLSRAVSNQKDIHYLHLSNSPIIAREIIFLDVIPALISQINPAKFTFYFYHHKDSDVLDVNNLKTFLSWFISPTSLKVVVISSLSEFLNQAASEEQPIVVGPYFQIQFGTHKLHIDKSIPLSKTDDYGYGFLPANSFATHQIDDGFNVKEQLFRELREYLYAIKKEYYEERKLSQSQPPSHLFSNTKMPNVSLDLMVFVKSLAAYLASGSVSDLDCVNSVCQDKKLMDMLIRFEGKDVLPEIVEKSLRRDVENALGC